MSTLSAPSKQYTPGVEAEASVLALASRITPSPATSQIRDARSTLAETIGTNENALHDIATGHTKAIAQQLDRNARLNQNSDLAQREVCVLAEDFDISSTENVREVELFCKTASSLHTSRETRALANATARALDNLKQRYDLLSQVEEGVWSGMSADASTVASLVQLDLDVQHNTAGAAVQIALATRCSILRTMVSEQLSNAWMQTVTVVDNNDGRPAINIRNSIILSPPKGARTTQKSKRTAQPPSYSLVDLCDSLDMLKTLPALLHETQTRVLRGVIEPLLEHPTWRPVEHAGDNEHGLKTTIVPAQDRLEVIANIKAVLEFVHRALPQRCRPMASGLQESAFNLVLSRILIPSLPASLLSLPEWLRLARQAAEWEASLRDDDNGAGILRPFLDSRAGQLWLQKRQSFALRQARRVAYEAWSSWESQDVRLGDEKQSSPRASSKFIANDEDVDGWGFDNDPQPAASKGDISMASKANVDDGNDGWDFDDMAPTPIPATPALPPIKPREAKRLGKKATHKAATQESTLPSPPAALKQAAEPLALARHNLPIPPSAPTFSPTFKVSRATDTVLEWASSTLGELTQLSSLHPVEPSFAGASRSFAEQLAEALDLLRISVPVAQAKPIETSPIYLVQLSNDYKYLSLKLDAIQLDVEWMDRADIAHRFATASDITLESFVATQTSAVADMLDGTHGFADTSNTNSYMQAEYAVQQLASYITDVATQLATYVDQAVYHNVLGKLVESTVVSILDHVLALEDITELESQRIGSILSHIEPLEHLFQHDPAHVSTAAAFIPHWIKFGYLNEILRAKLVEISSLYDNGSLVDFTPGELGGLVRALFADSPQRATLLDKVEM